MIKNRTGQKKVIKSFAFENDLHRYTVTRSISYLRETISRQNISKILQFQDKRNVVELVF